MATSNFPHISQDIEAESTAKIIGEVYIDEKCQLGKNVVLDGSENRIVIAKNCTIGDETIINPSDGRLNIWDNVKIGKNCKIQGNIGINSLIEDNVKVLAGAIIGNECLIKEGETVPQQFVVEDKHIFENGEAVAKK